MGSKEQYSKMEQELWALPFLLVLLRTAGLCLGLAKEVGFETRILPFFQGMQHLNKTSFLFHQQLPLKFGFCGSRQMKSPFLFGNIISLSSVPGNSSLQGREK